MLSPTPLAAPETPPASGPPLPVLEETLDWLLRPGVLVAELEPAHPIKESATPVAIQKRSDRFIILGIVASPYLGCPFAREREHLRMRGETLATGSALILYLCIV